MKRNFTLLLLVICMYGCKKSGTSPYQTDRVPNHTGFALSGNYLFSADQHDLVVYDISNPATPVKAGFSPLHGAIDTVFTIPGGVMAGLAGYQMQSFSAAAVPQLQQQYMGWQSKAQVGIYSQFALVTFNHDSSNLLLYNTDSSSLSGDPSLQSLFVYQNGSNLESILVQDSTCFVITRDELTVLAIRSNLLADVFSQTYPGAAMEELSVAGNELAVRTAGGYYFFDITQPHAPVLRAEIDR